MSARAKKLPVPDVAGLTLPIAQRVIANAGFPGARVIFVEAYEPPNTVIAQQPTRGSLLESDQMVTVHVVAVSPIRYLPALYHPRTPEDQSFLRNYLWIFHSLRSTLTDHIDIIHEQFNPYTVRDDFLPWLASWFGIAFDETMSDTRRRRILKEAAALFRTRGTKTALLRMIKLFTELDVEIEENRWPYKGLRIGISSEIGVDTMILPEISMSHTFVVKINKTFEELGETTLVRLHHMIEAEKPANSNYFLQFTGAEGVSEYEGMMRVGTGFAIGVGIGAESVEEIAPTGEEAGHG